MIEVGDIFLELFFRGICSDLPYQYLTVHLKKHPNFMLKGKKWKSPTSIPRWGILGQSSRPSILCCSISMSLSRNLVLPVFLDLISIKVW